MRREHAGAMTNRVSKPHVEALDEMKQDYYCWAQVIQKANIEAEMYIRCLSNFTYYHTQLNRD